MIHFAKDPLALSLAGQGKLQMDAEHQTLNKSLTPINDTHPTSYKVLNSDRLSKTSAEPSTSDAPSALGENLISAGSGGGPSRDEFLGANTADIAQHRVLI